MNIRRFRQGDCLLTEIDSLPKGAKKLETRVVEYGEATLQCGCHKVTTEGFVYSCLKQFSKKGTEGIQTVRTNNWKQLKGVLTKGGYLQTIIHGKIWRISRLIALTFIANPNNYPEVQHINGVRTENRLENLKWGTQKDNAFDRDLHGTTQRGTKHANAKLNNEVVLKIRELRPTYSLNQLAGKFGVSKKLVLLVTQNKIWKHVQGGV